MVLAQCDLNLTRKFTAQPEIILFREFPCWSRENRYCYKHTYSSNNYLNIVRTPHRLSAHSVCSSRNLLEKEGSVSMAVVVQVALRLSPPCRRRRENILPRAIQFKTSGGPQGATT